MTTTDPRTDGRPEYGEVGSPVDREPVELVARIERLEAELQDLHARYSRIHQAQYRGTALGLGLIGLAAVGGALVYPDSSQVLFALGGTGLFGAVLIYYLTPERFISADVGEHVYEALSSNEAAVVTELGLQDVRIYVPTSAGSVGGAGPARLFVPQHADFEVPPDDTLDARFVITSTEAQRGLSFVPSAAGLVAEFETTLSTGLSDSPSRLSAQLVDGLVNGFELVDAVTPEVSRADGRARFAVDGSVYGHVDHFDNPVASFVATGLAIGLDRPVTTTVTSAAGAPRADFLVECEWTPSDAGPASVE